MELEIELVPATAWYSNLRNNISKSEWDKIRKETYKKAENKCQICGASSKLDCHEIWDYDDKNNIQKLKGFTALCDDCHMIKHIGFAEIQVSKGLLNMNKLIEHFIKINKVTKQIFEECYEQAFKTWEERSQKEWITDLGEWGNLIK
ncbi:MAG: HNH endonuclease [Nanoarchaeota archaeon]